MPSPFAVLVQSPYLLCCKHDEVWIQLVVDVQLADVEPVAMMQNKSQTESGEIAQEVRVLGDLT